MGIFNSKRDFSNIKVASPKNVLVDMMRTASGASIESTMRHSIFYQLIGFKGVKAGLGTSTLIANTAVALAKYGLDVCVVDTSILSPCQDVLLKTAEFNDAIDLANKRIKDWFDLGMTEDTVLHTSTINKKIKVLSFYKRTIVDLLSTIDSSALVELAFSQLQTNFDIILIDICDEQTNIASTALQLSHRVLQIWNNSEPVMRNIENSIATNITLACSMDKMKNVILSNTIDTIDTDWETIFKKFHFNRLAKVGMSLRLSELMAMGKIIYNFADSDKAVQEYNDCIADIVQFLVNFDEDTKSIKNNEEENIENNTKLNISDDINLNEYPEVSKMAKQDMLSTTEYDNK